MVYHAMRNLHEPCEQGTNYSWVKVGSDVRLGGGSDAFIISLATFFKEIITRGIYHNQEVSRVGHRRPWSCDVGVE